MLTPETAQNTIGSGHAADLSLNAQSPLDPLILDPQHDNEKPEISNDEASDRQLQIVQDEARVLAFKAAEIESQALQMQQELGGGASSEVQHALIQAGTMRTAADQINAAVSNATRDPKTGKKRISISRLSAITGAAAQIEGQGSAEVTALSEATQHGHDMKGEILSEHSKAKPKTIAGHVKTICHGAACAVGLSSQRTHGGTGSWFSHARDMVEEKTAGFVQNAGNMFGAIRDHVAGFGETILHSAPVAAVGSFIAHPVQSITGIAHAAKQKASQVIHAGGQVIDQGVKAVKGVASSAHQALSNAYHGVTETIASWLPGHTAKPNMAAHAKSAPAHANPNMAKALHQARGIHLQLPAHPIEDAWEALSSLVPHFGISSHGVSLAH